MLRVYESRNPNESTWTEWSMMRSTGTRGSTRPASLPARCIAERIAERSTTAGTPVKSCMRTRAGRKGSSAPVGGGAGQPARAPTLTSEAAPVSFIRSSPSSSTLTVIGRCAVSPRPALGSACREWNARALPHSFVAPAITSRILLAPFNRPARLPHHVGDPDRAFGPLDLLEGMRQGHEPVRPLARGAGHVDPLLDSERVLQRRECDA